MYNIGMVGLNPGNGHPYSFSAVFNGFNQEALDEFCEFSLIRKYLRDFHGGRDFIPEARVTHVWTENPDVSRKIAAVSKIPRIASSLDELVESVDAVIFARDDVWNHWEMSKKIFASGKPLFMDKLLSPDRRELEFFAECAQNYPLMTSSSFRWSPLVDAAAKQLASGELTTVYGAAPCIWERYAPHLLEPLFHLIGNRVVSVQNAGSENADTVILTFATGVQAVLQVFDRLSLPIELVFRFRGDQPPYTIPYTDPTLEHYFNSIVEMMKAFTAMLKTGITPTPLQNTIQLNNIVIAALESRQNNGRKIYIDREE